MVVFHCAIALALIIFGALNNGLQRHTWLIVCYSLALLSQGYAIHRSYVAGKIRETLQFDIQ